MVLPALGRIEASVDGPVSESEPLERVVKKGGTKDAERLSEKTTASSTPHMVFERGDIRVVVDLRRLPHSSEPVGCQGGDDLMRLLRTDDVAERLESRYRR